MVGRPGARDRPGSQGCLDVDDALHAQIRERFKPHIGSDGIAHFLNPLRVDLLRKP